MQEIMKYSLNWKVVRIFLPSVRTASGLWKVSQSKMAASLCSPISATTLTLIIDTMGKQRIYIVRDQSVEQAVYDEDLDAFREIIEDGADFREEKFDSEEETTAYVSGLYAGIDQRSPAGFIVLYESEESDTPFIDILKEQ